MNKLASILHNPPKTRPGTCEKHGEFTSRCFVNDNWTTCQVCIAEDRKSEQQIEAEKARLAADQAWAARIGHAGIPERFRDRSLDNFIAETPAQKKALEFAKRYAHDFDRIAKVGSCALFIGQPGTGKTHLAVGIGMHVMPKHSVLFATVMRAMRRVKDTWSRDSRETESQAIAALVYPSLLILDEVGVQFGSEAEKLILFEVLNERYEKRKPTILLSNLSLEEVKASIGERIYDRLREDKGECIVFNWASHRG